MIIKIIEIIYNGDGKKWITKEGDYLWTLMTDEEICEIDSKIIKRGK